MPVPAAHTPMWIIFSLLNTGTIAMPTGVSMPPNTAATFSRKISSRAAVMPLGGTDSSSRCTSSSLRPPSRPPLALISSIATASPRVIASPDCADAPDRAATWPILIGSAACAAPRLATIRANVAAISRATAGHGFRCIGFSCGWCDPSRSRDVRRRYPKFPLVQNLLPGDRTLQGSTPSAQTSRRHHAGQSCKPAQPFHGGLRRRNRWSIPPVVRRN